MMTKLLLTTYCSAEEVESMIGFLDEIKGCLESGYGSELSQLREARFARHALINDDSSDVDAEVDF